MGKAEGFVEQHLVAVRHTHDNAEAAVRQVRLQNAGDSIGKDHSYSSLIFTTRAP